MINEAYVSFEAAKLLNKKHFIGECHKCYYQYKEDENRIVLEDIQGDSREIDAPTQAMAMAWLREEHGIYIIAEPDINDKHCFYPVVYTMTEETWEQQYFNELEEEYCKSPEEAVEAALKYSLENLI